MGRESDLSAVDCLVVAPRTGVHVDAIKDHLGRLLSPSGVLVMVLDGAGEALAASASLLSMPSLSPPRWVVLERARQLALVWGEGEVTSWVDDLDALLLELSPATTRVLRPQP